MQDVPLEDIARIEVIRGPGGSIWGANAVNGVINIITKRAEETQGALISTAVGSAPFAAATARYGGKVGADTFYRGYVKGMTHGDSGRPEGRNIAAADAWDQKQAGFRADTKTAVGDPITISGQLYRGNYGTTGITAPLLTPPYALTFDDVGDVSGVNLLGNWQHELTERSAIETRAFYRRDNRKEQGLIFNLDTVDLDVHTSMVACAARPSAPALAIASSTTASTAPSRSRSSRSSARTTSSRPSSRTRSR